MKVLNMYLEAQELRLEYGCICSHFLKQYIRSQLAQFSLLDKLKVDIIVHSNKN